MKPVCNVLGCYYFQSSTYYDFPLCELHDHPKTHAILESMRLPGHFWCRDKPIVMPVRGLEESDLRENFNTMGLWPDDDPLLQEIDFSARVFEDYDLFA